MRITLHLLLREEETGNNKHENDRIAWIAEAKI